MNHYRLSILLSAFLLFLVQPVMTKFFLPWFGGSASVWATSLMFFTTVLLCGYLYAHGLTRLSQKAQLRIHGALIVISSFVLIYLWIKWGSPLTPSNNFRPDPNANPSLALLLRLGLVIAFPYILLSATSPLLQSWFFKTNKKTAYTLYAVSNIGSLGALLSYPFIFEPLFALKTQGWIWGGGFLLFSALILSMIVSLSKKVFVAPVSEAPVVIPQARVLQWIALSLFPAFLLVATTNALTQGIASFPFLWIVPLAIYLITFILAFSDRRFSQKLFLIFTFGFSVITLFFLRSSVDAVLPLHLFILLPFLFLNVLLFHQWLYQVRPEGADLTKYYLWISFGGALGTGLCSLVFPYLFTHPIEFQLSVMIALMISGWKLMNIFHPLFFSQYVDKKVVWFFGMMVSLFVLTFFTMGKTTALFEDRTFYSIIRVGDVSTITGDERRMSNGRILHGIQLLEAGKQFNPTSYFGWGSGIGQVLGKEIASPMRVGVIGLGVGSLAAYCRPGDVYRFYEIDPMVGIAAKKWFTYLDFCAGSEVIYGDGRISLENEELKADELFDVLIFDAFTDDSIPVHLLTKEAVDLYFRRLKPGGIVAVNISNRFVDLKSVLRTYLQNNTRFGVLIEDSGDESERTFSSVWVLLSEDENALPKSDKDFFQGRQVKWTDDYSNLFSVIRL